MVYFPAPELGAFLLDKRVTCENKEVEELTQTLKRLFTEESGQGMVEYGLILALVAIAAIVVLGTLGDTIKETFDKVVKGLTGASEAEG